MSKFKKFFMTVLMTFSFGVCNAQDMVTILCDNYINAISGTAFMFREQGYPIGMATEQVYNMGIDDLNMIIFLVEYVNTIYKDPMGTKGALRLGMITKRCVKATRGY